MRNDNLVADEFAKAGALSGLRNAVDTVCDDKGMPVKTLAGAARILSGWQSNAELYGALALVSRVAAGDKVCQGVQGGPGRFLRLPGRRL